jgi:hypothetical protein
VRRLTSRFAKNLSPALYGFNGARPARVVVCSLPDGVELSDLTLTLLTARLGATCAHQKPQPLPSPVNNQHFLSMNFI